MITKSSFPATIEFDGSTWYLVHDPNDPNSVRPNINEQDVQCVSSDPVKLPNNPNQLWLVAVSVLVPSQTDSRGRIIGSRRMVGFRLNDQQPVQGSPVRPDELVYYVAAQTDGSSAAQRFIDAIFGSLVPQQEEDKADTSWCKQMFSGQSQPQQMSPTPVHQQPVQHGLVKPAEAKNGEGV